MPSTLQHIHNPKHAAAIKIKQGAEGKSTGKITGKITSNGQLNLTQIELGATAHEQQTASFPFARRLPQCLNVCEKTETERENRQIDDSRDNHVPARTSAF